MSIAQLNELRVHYEITGDAGSPVIVFSNSLGTNLRLWDAQASNLRGFRILRYDSRGHGQSDVTPGEYSIEMLGHDVIALLDFLDIPAATFCGLSLGGVLGLWLGVHAPQRITRLLLANTAAKISTAETWNQRIREVMSDGIAAIADGVLSRWLTEPFRKEHPDRAASLKGMLLATSNAGYASTCAAVRDVDLRAEVKQIAVPTHIIAGSADVVTSIADAEFLRDRIAGATLTVVSAAHLSNIEAEDDFDRAFLKFLAASTPAS